MMTDEVTRRMQKECDRYGRWRRSRLFYLNWFLFMLLLLVLEIWKG